jgi:uncharacterized protein YijF (DUF1287 family)
MSLLEQLLADDGYKEVTIGDCRVGDIVVYYKDGEAAHTGVVVDNDAAVRVPIVWSKWGSGPEVRHALFDVPTVYGTHHRFFTCKP